MTEMAGGCNERIAARMQKVIGCGSFVSYQGLSSEMQQQPFDCGWRKKRAKLGIAIA
jgi:hypothetical protein